MYLFCKFFESIIFYRFGNQARPGNILVGTRLVVSVRGDESQGELEILKSSDVTMVLHNLPYTEEKIGRVQAARRYVASRLKTSHSLTVNQLA